MIPHPFARDTIYVTNPTYVQEYGNSYPTWPAGSPEIEITDCYIEPGDTSEDQQRAQTDIAEFTIYAPLEHFVDADAQVRFTHAGIDYTEVSMNPPARRPDPAGILDHQVIRVQERRG